MTAPVLGPCQAWIDGADVAACCPGVDVGTGTTGILDAVAVAASQVLYELSGEQFSGACQETIRPCATGPCGWWGAGNPGLHWGSFWLPVGGLLWGWGSGEWDHLACGCQPLSEVVLGYPVVSVDEVLIDGVVVPPAEYRVDDYRLLVRLADTSFTPPRMRYWPSCQNLALDSTEPGTFEVTYTHGVLPPPVGEQAAAQLACQLYLSCYQPGQCVLPVGVTSVTRQGVTINRAVLATWFTRNEQGGWQTGLPFVDAFLMAYNPHGLRRPPTVWSPDVRPFGRRAGT